MEFSWTAIIDLSIIPSEKKVEHSNGRGVTISIGPNNSEYLVCYGNDDTKGYYRVSTEALEVPALIEAIIKDAGHEAGDVVLNTNIRYDVEPSKCSPPGLYMRWGVIFVILPLGEGDSKVYNVNGFGPVKALLKQLGEPPNEEESMFTFDPKYVS